MPSITSILETARRAILAGSYDYAIILAYHVISHYPKCVEGYTVLGRAYIEKGMPDKAEHIFKLVLSVDPEDFTGHVGLGVALRDRGDAMEALDQFERAIDLKPGSPTVRQEIVRLRQALGVSNRERVKITHVGLAKTYINAGLYKRAIDELKTILEANPANLDAMVTLAEAQWLAGKSAEALQTCLHILELSPDCLKPKLILADIYFSEGAQGKAATLFKEAQALDAGNHLAKSFLAERKVLAILPEDAETDLALPEGEATTALS